jgi:hypothetical protein
MKKEFKLIDKRKQVFKDCDAHYFEEDIKEFIGLLKEYIEEDMVFYDSDDEQYHEETKEDLIYFIDSITGFSNTQRKKDENDGSNVVHLETRNNAEEVNKTEQRSAIVDNHAETHDLGCGKVISSDEGTCNYCGKFIKCDECKKKKENNN